MKVKKVFTPDFRRKNTNNYRESIVQNSEKINANVINIRAST